MERIFTVLALLVFMGAVLPVLQNPTDTVHSAESLDVRFLIIRVAIYSLVLLFMLKSKQGFLRKLSANPVLFSLIILIGISTSWSPVPMLTLRRSVALFLTTIFGLYLGIRYSMKQQIRLIVCALFIAVLLSILFIQFLPLYGIDTQAKDEAWRGVFMQKNIMGRYMVIGLVSFLCAPVSGSKEMILKVFGICSVLVLLTGSHSAGSYLVAVLVLLLMTTLKLWNLARNKGWGKLVPLGVGLGTLLVAGMGAAGASTGALLELLGRNSTLTGRVALWDRLLHSLAESPWVGYGYGGFWATENVHVLAGLGWSPLKAHNGYLDLCLDLGLAGLTIFLANSMLVLWRCLKLAATRGSLHSLWPLTILSTILLYNCFESDLLIANNFIWVVYVAITVSTQRSLMAQEKVTQSVVVKTAALRVSECT